MPLFSKEKCLALFLSLNLSKRQYIKLRQTCIESGTNQWQSYYEIQAKLELKRPVFRLRADSLVGWSGIERRVERYAFQESELDI